MAERSRVFTGKKIALAAMFTALSWGLSYLEFPIFPSANFLKLDFSFSLQLIAGYMLGPVLGEMIVLCVQLLRFILPSVIGTPSGGVGEIANFIAGTCFIFVPSVIYRFKKGFPTVIVSLVIGIVLQVAASLLSNRFLTFPLYMGADAESAFNSFFFVIVAFNLIKGVVNALIALLLYKRLKKLFFKNEIGDKEKKTQTGEKGGDGEYVICAYCGGKYKGEKCPNCGSVEKK